MTADKVLFHDSVLVSIKKGIDESIITLHLHTMHIYMLIHKLKNCFDIVNTGTKSNLISSLFSIKGHVTQFDQSLARLEESYKQLNSQGTKVDDDIYLAAIRNTTPSQYQNIIAQYKEAIDNKNEDGTNITKHKKPKPEKLLEKL